jgi:hypothetical protein
VLVEPSRQREDVARNRLADASPWIPALLVSTTADSRNRSCGKRSTPDWTEWTHSRSRNVSRCWNVTTAWQSASDDSLR